MNGEKLWSLVLKEVKDNISAPSYQTWFVATKVRELSHNELIVEVSNEFQQDWLYGRYYELVNKHVNHLAETDDPVEVVFVAENGGISRADKNIPHYVSNDELLAKIDELTIRVDELESRLKNSE